MPATKTLIATAAAAMVAVLALATNGVDAGTVSLYEHAYHQGRSITFDIWSTEQCYNVGCFNDIASSARWGGLTPGYNVYFFSEINCDGRFKDWPTTETQQPNNFEVDYMNDQVTSVLIARSASQVYYGNVPVCPFSEGAAVTSGNASNASNATNATVAVAETPAPTVVVAEGH